MVIDQLRKPGTPFDTCCTVTDPRIGKAIRTGQNGRLGEPGAGASGHTLTRLGETPAGSLRRDAIGRELADQPCHAAVGSLFHQHEGNDRDAKGIRAEIVEDRTLVVLVERITLKGGQQYRGHPGQCHEQQGPPPGGKVRVSHETKPPLQPVERAMPVEGKNRG